MAVVDADIVIYGSASMPDNDTPTNIGGAIDTAKKIVFTDIDVAGAIEILSDGADVRTATLHYLRSGSGVIKTEAKVLTGTTAVIFTDTDIISVLKLVLSAADGARTVTLRKSVAGATLMTLGPNFTEGRRPFFDAQANASGGATKKYYDKVFIKNTNTLSDLSSAKVILQADPEAVIAFALETVLDGVTTNGAGNNRLVTPSGFVFDSTDKNVANSQVLSRSKAQGVWLELTLSGGKAPKDSTFTMRLQGIAS